MRGPPPSIMPVDLHALTSLRALLALGVALFHYHLVWDWRDVDVTSLIERSRLGLDAFFILSGFILTHVYARSYEEGRFRYGAFLTARIARIWPMHLAALAVFVVIVAVAISRGAHFDRAALPWSDLLRAVTLTQAWTPDPRPNGWNGPSWSLSAEWFAYLAFPAFAWIGWKLKRRPWLLLALAALAFAGLDALYRALYGVILPRAEEALGVLRILPEFLYGVALWRLASAGTAPSRPVAVGGACFSFVLLLAAMHAGADDRLIVVLWGPAILSLALLASTGGDAPLSRPWMRLAGEASYAFYLLHMPVMIGWRGLAVAIGGRADGYAMPLWEVACALALTAAASLIAYIFWERPARRWIRAAAEPLLSRRRTLAA